MKNTLYLLLVMLLSFSCNDDYLELTPVDSITDKNFWNTATDVELYTNQFYTELQSSNGYIWVKAKNSDNQGPSGRDSYLWGNSSVPTSGGGWGKSDWLQIRRANFALVRIAEMDQSDEIQQYEGEIRFFKSKFYFEKLKMFGNVPWYDTDLGIDSEGLFKARDSRQDVVTNIFEDLDFAIEHLPETSPSLRVTKYAALALKLEIGLFEGTFRKYHELGEYESVLREAAKAGEDLIGSGLFSVYNTGKPNDDYFDLFVQYDLSTNPEAIMFIQYIKDKFMHNEVRYLGETSSGYTKDFVESYLCKDGLPISLSPQYKGDAVFGDEFINRDPRMYQSIYTSERPYRIYPDGSTDYKNTPQFRQGQCYTGYEMIKRYSPYEVDRIGSQCVIDQFIFRYGRSLLDYAEIKAELGECTQDVLDMTVNQLRDRVGMPHLTVDVGFTDPNWPDWEVPVSPLMNEIRRERRIETTLEEDRRWTDLLRWKAGKLLENKKTLLGARDPDTGEYRELYPGFDRAWEDKLYLHPLPIQDLVLNPNLTQNPGWEQ